MAKAAFDTFKNLNFPLLSDDDAFERFAAEVMVRRYGLSWPAIERGVVGAGDDGGIDSFHVFLDSPEHVEPDSIRLTNRKNALDGIRDGVTIELVIVQAKTETKWDTNVFGKMQSALEAILDDSVSTQTLRSFPLNEDVIESALMLRKLRQKLAGRLPKMKVTLAYVTFAEQGNIVPYMETKRSQLESFLLAPGRLPTGSTATVEYVGDTELVARLRVSSDFKAELILAKQPVRVNGSLVGVVTIADYLKFLSAPKSNVIREELFAVNVRYYAGKNVGVNKAITETLASDTGTEFWWLNNGITILADKASDPVDEFHWNIVNPLIVNGLQTSHVIHESALTKGGITKKRLAQHVLVRLIQESDPQVREAIIRGTNNQTAIAGIQLHANEESQHRIEDYLRNANWFYERRRYQYRGTPTPAGRIRSITDLAQAVLSYRFLEPDVARARPGTVLGSAAGWNRVFEKGVDEDLYLKALNVAEVVDAYLRTPAAKTIADDATNSRHYLVAGYALRSSKVKAISDYAGIPVSGLKASPTAPVLAELHRMLRAEFDKLDDKKAAPDTVFKGAKLRPAYFATILALNAK
jgi:hypothetical protein